MMGGRGPIPCKFGVQCHRQDCWFSHPDGRIIDAGRNSNSHSSGSAPGGPSNGVSRGAPVPPVVGGMRPGMMPGFGGTPQASPRMGGGGGSAGGGGGNECRYSFECKRRDCHFNHPFGRAIDGDGGGAGGARPLLTRPPSTSSVGSVTRGMSEVSFGSYPPANATDDEQDLKDTWFPKARDCTCCKGFVYGCTSDICESMGQCTCSIEEKDLDGSSSVSSSSNSIPRTGSPQVEMGANGSGPTMGRMQVGGARPPQPPTEASLAAAAAAGASISRGMGGGGRPSPKRGGAECRYGTGCKRADCSFSHPQGRSMDADGVSFGDFGPGNSGGGPRGGSSGGRMGGGKPTVDQDLMDTWYPDCRECTCCKGYKHGCKTAGCAAVGLCACSAEGRPTAPISAVPVTSNLNIAPSGTISDSLTLNAKKDVDGTEKVSAVEAAGMAAGKGEGLPAAGGAGGGREAGGAAPPPSSETSAVTT